MKKFLLIIIFIFLTACTITEYLYYPSNYSDNKLSIFAYLINYDTEDSPINYISVSDRRSSVATPHNIQILSPSIKIVSNGKEYNIATNKSAILVYKQGVTLIDDFIVYIGKVQLDTGEIIDIPPLHFKKHVYVEKYDAISDAINKGANRRSIFSGTIEEYREWKKKNR